MAPTRATSGADVGQDVTGVTKTVFARYLSRLFRTVVPHHDVRELACRNGFPAADVENSTNGGLVLEYEYIGVNDVIDIDVVADRLAVFVKYRCQT